MQLYLLCLYLDLAEVNVLTLKIIDLISDFILGSM